MKGAQNDSLESYVFERWRSKIKECRRQGPISEESASVDAVGYSSRTSLLSSAIPSSRQSFSALSARIPRRVNPCAIGPGTNPKPNTNPNPHPSTNTILNT